MNLVMIGIHQVGKKIVGYRILDTEEGNIKDVPSESVQAVLGSAGAEVENIELLDGKIVGSNGALGRYPVITGGRLVGKSPIIILFELVDHKYRVTNYMGEIVDIDESEAIRYAKTEGIANGKIVQNSDGKEFISSISGSYQEDGLIADRKSGKRMSAKLKMVGNKQYEINENMELVIKDFNITELVVPKGVLIIPTKAFYRCRNLEKVVLPQTLEEIQPQAFLYCISLKEIEIPEGIKVLRTRTFEECNKLKKVTLPNSLEKIEDNAFINCRALKEIERSRNEIEMSNFAVPRGVRIVRRKV